MVPRWQGTAICKAATQYVFKSLESESIGTNIAALLLADLISAISPANTGATITVAVSDVPTSTRMVLYVTCHSAAAAIASCLQSGATSFCCCGTDTNALICTPDLPTTTICLECAASVHEVRLWTACTFPSGSCECHSCEKLQITSASTETDTRWLPRLNHASAPVSFQCLCFSPDPVCSTDTLSTDTDTTVSVLNVTVFVSECHG
jgi:hypothetical protein